MTELVIVFAVTDGVQLMDIAGPADVFAEANTLHGARFTGLSLLHRKRLFAVLVVLLCRLITCWAHLAA